MEGVLLALPVGLAAVLALRRLDDSDPWWHLAAGRWIAQHGTVPRTDPFSFTVPDHPWIDVQWLFDLIVYGLFHLGGAPLLVLAAALAYGLAMALLVRNLRLRLGPVAAALLGLWAASIAQERFTVRPEMVSFILLQLLLWLFATAPRDEGRRLRLVPVIMVVWANTHSLFIVGVGLIGCYVAGVGLVHVRWLPAAWRASWSLTAVANRRVIFWGLLAVLATTLNPYGVEGAIFPVKLLSRISGSNPVFQAINEFRSPFSGYSPSWALDAYRALLTLSAGVVGLAALLTAISHPAASRRVEVASSHAMYAERTTDQGGAGFNVARCLFFMVLAYLSVLARRNMALFAFGVMPFVGECLLVVYAEMPLSLRRACLYGATILAVILPPAVAAGAWFVITNGFYRWDLDTHEFGIGVQESNFPIRAVAFVREMALPPRLYNDLTSGGYLNWDSPMTGGVYIDGRLEVYDVDFFSSYMAAVSDPALWQAEADRVGVATVLFDHRWDERSVLLLYLLQDARWALVYYDEMAVVFVRTAGHEELIDRAKKAFSTINERTMNNILAPTPWWRWPAGRVLALWNYGNVSALIGQPDTAARCFAQLLTLELPRPWEVQMAVRLADYHLRKGDRATARSYLLHAADLSPGDPTIARLLAQAGE